MTATKYNVARIYNGKPYDWLHSEAPDGSRIMVCTNQKHAMIFDTIEEAADAAGRAMNMTSDLSVEYRAVPASK